MLPILLDNETAKKLDTLAKELHKTPNDLIKELILLFEKRYL